MNDSQIRAVFPLPAESPALDAKIDRALAHAAHVHRTKRRVTLGFAVTAALALVFVAGPAVEAQASLIGIVHALDKQTDVKITTYTLDGEGHRFPSAITTLGNGDAAYVDGNGTRQVYDVGAKTYSLDPILGRFVVMPRRPSRSIRLSDMLGPAGEFSVGKRAIVERVDGVVRATIENEGLPERYVIDADPKTDLPIRMHVDGKERGEWRAVSELEFDYTAPIATIAPDLDRYPAITPEAAARAFEGAMTGNVLAEIPLKRGRLVVRRIDVAQDGTVFVAYQSRDGVYNSWSGYALDVADDLGTRYIHVGDITNGSDDAHPPEGAIQLEVFTPAVPIASHDPRTLQLATHVWSNGGLARSHIVGSTYPDGHTDWYEQLNAWSRKDVSAKEVPLWRERLSAPTCGAMPAWAQKMSSSFSNDAWAEMAKARYRADLAMQENRWDEAEAQSDLQLVQIKDGERQGYGPYSRTGVLEDLDRIHAAQRGEAVSESKDRILVSRTDGFGPNGRRL